VDGRVGFTGGMNIDADYLADPRPAWPKHDLHFEVRGPVLGQMLQVFMEDWAFTTGEVLRGERWAASTVPAGPVLARGVPDGPDEDRDKLPLTLQAALASARSSVAIVTPYFLPDAPLIAALNIAAMRGVRVDIVLPRENNLKLVGWATQALLEQVLGHGCRVWYSPPPFDHTKLMVVDRVWSFLGSANWDTRSLRLNFEFNLECYGLELAASLDEVACRKRAGAEAVTLETLARRSLPVKLRDGVARLLTPYL
jgi:cardiolipin synthase